MTPDLTILPWDRIDWPVNYQPGDPVWWFDPNEQWVAAVVIATDPVALAAGELHTPGLRLRALTAVGGQRNVVQVDSRSRFVQPGRQRPTVVDQPAGSCTRCGERLYADLGTAAGERLCKPSHLGQGLHEYEPARRPKAAPAQRVVGG